MSNSSSNGTNAFCKHHRLLKGYEFQHVFDVPPYRASHPALLVLAKPNNLEQARVGLVIGKKHIRSAVRRNRIKRLIRESFRSQLKYLPPIDVIVLARGSADTEDNEKILYILNGLWKRISKKHHKNAEQK